MSKHEVFNTLHGQWIFFKYPFNNYCVNFKGTVVLNIITKRKISLKFPFGNHRPIITLVKSTNNKPVSISFLPLMLDSFVNIKTEAILTNENILDYSIYNITGSRLTKADPRKLLELSKNNASNKDILNKFKVLDTWYINKRILKCNTLNGIIYNS
jgi:hypothetical protein